MRLAVNAVWYFAGQRPKSAPNTWAKMMKRVATWAFYAIGTLAVLYLALYAYVTFTGRQFTPGDPIHIFRNPNAPSYS